MKRTSINPTTPNSAQPHSAPNWVDHGVELTVLLAVGLTPLLFTPLTTELFELPKMILIYLLSILGLVFILLKIYYEKRLPIYSSPINRALALFITVFIISTVLSIDLYTSIMGYFSRFHGGLASLCAYLILAYLTLIHLIPSPTEETKVSADQRLRRLLWVWVGSSSIVSIWGILQHFGYDIGCLVVAGNIDATCWVQDVQARVFASFGQPNWLAAYLLTSLPISLYLLISSKHPWLTTLSWLIGLTNYAAFWYTFSRSGWIGLIASLIFLSPIITHPHFKNKLKWLVLLVVACIIVSLSGISMATQRTTTSLDSGEFDSSTGQIRLLVWQGTLETIKSYPIFGSGPETFAYSFLPHRPSALNQTTEWNFLYNKAHNEVLHLAATLGLVGVAAWLWLHVKLGLSVVRQYRSNSPRFSSIALFSGIVGAFTAQLFGFSVVATGLLFWIGAATIISREGKFRFRTFSPIAAYSTLGFGLLITVLLSLGLILYTAADILAAKADEQRQWPTASALNLEQALLLNPLEPRYHAWQARNYAHMAEWSPAPESYIQSSLYHLKQSYLLNQSNMINLKSLLYTYQTLARVDRSHAKSGIELAQHALQLDPHDASLHQTLAELYGTDQQPDQALSHYNQVVELRPNAANSYQIRANFAINQEDYTSALQDLYQAQKLEPKNQKINQKIEEILDLN